MQADELHPIKRVPGAVELGRAERHEQPVGAKLNILRHELGVHANERHVERLAHKLLLVRHGVAHDRVQLVVRELVLELVVEQARKVAVHALVARDELVGKREPGHEPALLEPEDGAKGAREEDALDDRKGHEALGKARRLLNPTKRPVGLLAHAGHRLQGVEEVQLLGLVLDVRVDQQRVRLRVDVLDHNLEAVEEARLGVLHLGAKPLDEVLIDDAVGRGKEGKDVLDEILLVVVELFPIVEIVGEIYLLGRPKRRLCLLEHEPQVVVLNRKDDKARGVLLQHRLVEVVGVRIHCVSGCLLWFCLCPLAAPRNPPG